MKPRILEQFIRTQFDTSFLNCPIEISIKQTKVVCHILNIPLQSFMSLENNVQPFDNL